MCGHDETRKDGENPDEEQAGCHGRNVLGGNMTGSQIADGGISKFLSSRRISLEKVGEESFEFSADGAGPIHLRISARSAADAPRARPEDSARSFSTSSQDAIRTKARVEGQRIRGFIVAQGWVARKRNASYLQSGDTMWPRKRKC